ncbi:AAA family ATPase [Rhodocyclus tenuis]|uniref:AAA family ATPase n=1 Tax=Rhodocyclus tenuis TaxID=1066 RepID=UPI0019044F1F|nr:AAA family ATPase [Rhodocyclus tenuis]MBK1680206.1 ATPase [Rhodocyclus tenuis]
MYLEHFGLREAPFRITPHTEFFFAGANRGATLDALAYAISNDEGIVKVSGEVGSGKTMLCRMLLEKLSPDFETVFLANPSLTREEILFAIASELKAPLPDERTRLLLGALQDRLIEIYASGRRVVVLIDEAHAMPPETLEEIRLLSNLETSRHKLVKIALFGQPELDQHLSNPSMRQLRERITHNFALEPLRRNDVGAYLMFRLRAAGYRGPDLFTPAARQLISDASEGLTRRINILADKALLAAFSEGGHMIDARQVKAAIADAQFGPMRSTPPSWQLRAGVGAAALIVVAALAYFAGTHTGAEAPLNAAASANLPTMASNDPAAPTRAREPATPQPMDGANRGDTSSTPASAQAGLPAATPAPPAASPTLLPAVAVATAPPSAGISKTLEERLGASEEWLRRAPDTHHFIQLFSTDAGNRAAAERFLGNVQQHLDPEQIHVYRSALSGREKIGVIYGDYPSVAAAESALARLPATIRESRPYVRQVSKLR